MLLKRFKEDKEIMVAEIDKAEELVEKATQIAESATESFVEKLRVHVKHASKQDLMEFLEAKDNSIEEMDKLAVAAMYADEHDVDIVAIGLK